jgi:hypothetical protein
MLDTWFSLPLGDGIMASVPTDEILAAFSPLYAAAGHPASMAVFTRFDSEGHLQCEVTAYFSPAAGELAKRLGAQPCARPSRGGLGLIAGDERAWEALFPGSNR